MQEDTCGGRDDSPSRGRMTITLHSTNTGAKDETARVKFELTNPELVAGQLVSSLARKFPPESVVTITSRAGLEDTSEESTAQTDDGTASTYHTPQHSHGRPRRTSNDESTDALSTEDQSPFNRRQGAVQRFFVSDELDMAVPVAEGQEKISLMDGTTMRVTSDDVCTFFYDEQGHVQRPGGSTSSMLNKRGLAVYAQDYLVSPALEPAVPVYHGQTQIHLVDGSVIPVRPQEIVTVFHDDRGLALFHRLSTGSVIPGPLAKEGVAILAVPHEIRWATQTAMPVHWAHKVVTQPTLRRAQLQVAMYDDSGKPMCTRNGKGEVRPDGIDLPGAADRVDYMWVCSDGDPDRAIPAEVVQVRQLRGPKATLSNGEQVVAYPENIAFALKTSSGADLGTSVPRQKARLQPGRPAKYVKILANRPVADGSHTARASPARDHGADSLKASWSQPENATRSTHRPPGRKAPPIAWRGESANSNDASGSVTSASSADFAARILKRNPKSETYCRTQRYFIPPDIDFAIPVLPGQQHVKMANGQKLLIEPGQVYNVDYDRRGFPIRTIHPDGKITSWMINRPGIAAKFQDYLVHSDLVYAVPILPDQKEVAISDGTSVSVPPSNVLSVYYDAAGKAAFSVAPYKNKIKPGLVVKPGIAHSVQYLLLIDCNDGTGEQFVVPFNANQAEVADPRESRHGAMQVDRHCITVAFFDKSRRPLYSQLADGTLVGGGLVGSRAPTDDESSQGRTEITSSFSGPGVNDFLTKLGNTDAVRRLSLGIRSGPLPSEISETPSSRRRIETIEVRTRVPQIEFVPKVVEVPEIVYVDKLLEVEQVEWKTKYVKKKQVIERPVEHIKYVPKIETKIVERVIEVPQIIEVPRREVIERKARVDRFVDNKKGVTVAQTIMPIVKDCPDIFEDVECLKLEPDLIPVDVFVPRLVKSKLLSTGKARESSRTVEVPLAHYNSLVLRMNPMFANNYEKLPMIKTSTGCFPLLPTDQQVVVVPPTSEDIQKVLMDAGVVSRAITPSEIARLEHSSACDMRAVGPASDDFAPRTSAIDHA